jgi:hypothetical protein
MIKLSYIIKAEQLYSLLRLSVVICFWRPFIKNNCFWYQSKTCSSSRNSQKEDLVFLKWKNSFISMEVFTKFKLKRICFNSPFCVTFGIYIYRPNFNWVQLLVYHL